MYVQFTFCVQGVGSVRCAIFAFYESIVAKKKTLFKLVIAKKEKSVFSGMFSCKLVTEPECFFHEKIQFS